MDMNNFGCHNVRKHREIKNSEKYINLDNMNITSSEGNNIKEDQERGLLPLWVSRPLGGQKNVKYAITNVSIKDHSNAIKDFGKLPYKGYLRKRPKHDPIDSYFI